MTPPLPPADTWTEFPVIAVIVLCFALAFTGLFFTIKWAWREYACERDKELVWRENQAALRDKAAAQQNQLWRDAMLERDMRYEKYDSQRQHWLDNLAPIMGEMNKLLITNDQQVRVILANQGKIIDQTRPR
jgi:hypothetical protein